MTGYTKLFGSIIASTIWRADDKTRIVWITMLAMANKNGVVEGSIPGLADLSRVSVTDCQTALRNLMSEDEFSRTKEHDGRRIEEVDGGWVILNHGKYRAKMNLDERREYLTEKQREHRAKQKCQLGVNNGEQSSTGSTHAEADAEPEEPKPRFRVDGLPENLRVPAFFEAWQSWEKHRREIKHSLTKTTAERQLKMLSKHGPEIAVAIIDLSIEKGWQGLFPEQINPVTKKPNGQKFNQNPPSRNIGHNAGLDYSRRPEKPEAPSAF